MGFDVPMHDVVTVAIEQRLKNLSHVVAENREVSHISSGVINNNFFL